MNIGKMIHNRRTQLGLTLEELGNKVGVGKSTVQKWENGFISNMRRDKIALLASALEISPVSFITGKLTFDEDILPKKINKYANKATPEDLNTFELYQKLDSQDKAEIRGEIKGMLRADKYKNAKSDNHEPFSGPRPAQVAAYGHNVMDVDNK